MALTDLKIRTTKPTTKDQFISDGRRLYLRVHTSGTKTFLYRDQTAKPPRWETLGEYPGLSLADARTRANDLKNKKVVGRVTVQTVYDDWIRSVNKSYKSPKQVGQRMGKHFLPKNATALISSIARADISAQLNEIAATAPVQANRVLTDVKLLFSYAVERGWLEVSPAELITQRTVGGKEKTRERVLTNEEIAELISILTANYSIKRECSTGFDLATRYALGLKLLTGQRSNEIRGFDKSELQGGVWTIPQARTKTVEMKVPMSPLSSFVARLAIKELGSVPFKGMEGQTLSHATRYMKFTPGFTPHDLRRTMRTRMADLGVLPHIGEKCLNHVLGGVLAIYDRGEYAAEKKQAWRLWHRHLMALYRGTKKAPV